ncbi:VOC family protein [Streptantibioticus ferralitis]|uniref:VOC family protein n=2 Tax=Streptantibioticus ferralitis TaxID=236510 RepID=A0ABT5Z9V0_9ACTN|nr:VOC family protein [Streptantibioticus ferralitis]
MSAFAEGAPCWVDAMLPDVAAGKRFYGELLGWTFEEGGAEGDSYSLALHDGSHVAALIPKFDGRMPTTWTVYFASEDAARTAEKIREAGGQIVMGPGQVGDFGTMAIAADPSGAVFGVWQGGRHQGFDKRDEVGAFGWTELYTREKDAVDPFYRQVFGYETEQIGDAGGDFDYEVWTLKRDSEIQYIAGRLQMGPDFPAGLPAHFRVYFVVDNCDNAVATVRKLGGRVNTEPQDSPHGRWASVIDDQGAHFTVIDTATKVGEI